MADSIDEIVKGTGHLLPAENVAKTTGTSGVAPASGKVGDPLTHAPSSPSMIYLNLLILEASLRAQYLELRARRRHHTFFLTLLTLWVVGFGYALFLAPREDGRGVGGSVYWVVEVTEKVCFMGGVITAILVWGTGIWDRGVRWPRRWFGVSNRGLRGFNCKLVVVKQPWWAEALSTAGWFLTYGLFSSSSTGSSFRYVEPSILRDAERELNLQRHGHQPLPIAHEDEERGGHEEDLAPGGDYVKLLLLAKPFSPTFRENWELYRTEYWERENERRALVRAKLKEQDRRLRRQKGGWLWWLPWRKPAAAAPAATPTPPAEKLLLHPHHHHAAALSEKGHHPRHSLVEKEHRRNRSGSVRRGSVSTIVPSRSTTPTPEGTPGGAAAGAAAAAAAPSPPAGAGLDEGPGAGVARKGSSASSASEKRRKKLSTSGTRAGKRPGMESRSVTPEIPSPLARESSLGVGGK